MCTFPCNQTVVLPFSGKLLPLKSWLSSQNEHEAVKSPAVTPSVAEPTTKPSKPAKHSTPSEVSKYIDTNVVKKQLFAAPLPNPQHQAPSSAIPKPKKKQGFNNFVICSVLTHMFCFHFLEAPPNTKHFKENSKMIMMSQKENILCFVNKSGGKC